jgi:hypothetical protein
MPITESESDHHYLLVEKSAKVYPGQGSETNISNIDP